LCNAAPEINQGRRIAPRSFWVARYDKCVMSTKTLIGAAVIFIALILIGAGFAIVNHVNEERSMQNSPATVSPTAPAANPLGNTGSTSSGNASGNPASNPLGQ
jgi:hypothetical protein